MNISINRLTILSCHPILDQVAADIAKGIEVEVLPDKDIVVCIGAHKRFKGLKRKTGFKICVQTEHFLDERGQALWRKPRWFRMLANLLICDLMLDLSIYNKKAYRWLPGALKNKIVFGPKIFPSAPVKHVEGNGTSVFFGTVNARRKKLIGASEAYVTLDEGIFGAALDEKIANASAVLNVHFSAGVYTEYPRLLSAYLAGKPLVSETLSPELEVGRHYIALGGQMNTESFAKIFANFSTEFAAHNRFTDFLVSYAK